MQPARLDMMDVGLANPQMNVDDIFDVLLPPPLPPVISASFSLPSVVWEIT